MGRQVTAASGGVTPMWRRADDKGDAIDQSEDGQFKLIEPDPNDYRTPQDDLKARYRLSGISESFEMESQFSDKPATKVRVEFEIVKVANANVSHFNGARFTSLYNLSTHPKSNLGKFLGRLRGQEIGLGETIDIDEMIGTTFVARCALTPDGRYANIDPPAIERESIKMPLGSANGSNGKTPEPAAVAANEGDSDDEWPGDDEDEDL